MADQALPQTPMAPSAPQEASTPVPSGPQIPGVWTLVMVAGGVVFLVIVAVLVVQSQKTAPGPAKTTIAASPAVTNTYVSQKYNFGVTFPNGWQAIDIAEHRKSYLSSTSLSDAQKQLLYDYYAKVEAKYRKSKQSRPSILVRVNDASGVTLADEVENHRQFLESLYSNLTYVVNSASQFQNQEAYRTETRGTVSTNELHAKEIIFVRDKLVFTFAMTADEKDWNKDLDELFEQTISSFSI